LNSPIIPSSVPTFPASTPNLGLRNWVNVAFTSAVLRSSGAGSRACVLTGTIPPTSLKMLFPKPVSAQTLKKPPGQRPSFCVSTLSV